MRKLKWPLAFTCSFLVVSTVFVACAKQGHDSGQANRSAVTEAYTLMDKGENARAVELLETVIADEPNNSEARLMLASAYMGKAGVDVLSLHDAFKDVLFSRSLSEVFTETKTAPETAAPPAPELDEDANRVLRAHDDTPAEKMIRELDANLDKLRRLMVIFDRFPHVSEKTWPLMDQALAQLDQLEPAKEVRVYRLFIRMVYFKEYLVRKVIRDSSFGTRRWACRLELEEFHEGMIWLSALLGRASEDFVALYPHAESPFERGRVMFKMVDDGLLDFGHTGPAGTNTGVSGSQKKLREAFQCGR